MNTMHFHSANAIILWGAMPRDVISILDLTRSEIERIFELSTLVERALRKRRKLNLLDGYTAALLFFEPSTRTRLSFEVACKKLGMDCLVVVGEAATSLAKGERLADTIRMLDSYADLIIIRHPKDGAARFAAEIAESPVLNAGDGAHEHPTQTLIDLCTIKRLKGRIDGLTIGVLGDVRYARAVGSLLKGLTLFSPKKVYLISPSFLRIRESLRIELKRRGLNFEEVENLVDVLPELDVLYVVRLQKERFPDPELYEKAKGSYAVTREILEKHAKSDLIVLHPLPRVDELDLSVDSTRWAAYFYQASLGVPVRIALIAYVFELERELVELAREGVS